MTTEPPKLITFMIDGLEVQAPDGEYLVDACKRGDVEIPYFCYDKKLVEPVGACRMCMVEIEGIPKLQTSCSTPVKDGMVVYTQTDRVKEAQNAVVEFLLVNHPLDCPVCDKGGECPLQDISFGWGPGRSRSIDDKRNFPKPIALSPLVAIDRERCILCYRCVRFSQEVSEDNQLAFLDRADHTFVGTFDGHPYVAPFAGNIIELCPVGALTSTAYRFRARPWDVEQAGSVCTLCPSQCNISFTVRDERVERVLSRDNDDVDNGWLCDLGRYGYQSIHAEERITQPLIRDGGFLRPTTWERAIDAAVEGLRKTGADCAAIVGGQTTNEEGYLLQRIFREALGSNSIDSRRHRIDHQLARWLSNPEFSASVPDIDDASVVLVVGNDPVDESPVLDLRIRKAVRHFGARLIVAHEVPTALDGGAGERLRYAPGEAESLLRAMVPALVQATEERSATSNGYGSHEGGGGEAGSGSNGGRTGQTMFELDQYAKALDRAAVDKQALVDVARLLVAAERVVIVWGERLAASDSSLATLAGFVALARAKHLEVGSSTNVRGLREVGCVPNMGPGLNKLQPAGVSWAEARDGAAKGFYLLHSDPMRELPGKAEWDAALRKSGFVIAHSQFPNESIEQHADVVFPAESYAEKEGTVTHPDGRLQRVRPAIGHPGDVRTEWRVLVELGNRLGLDLSAHVSSAAIFEEIARSVPMYNGLTHDEIGGKGMRWQERELSPEVEAMFPSGFEAYEHASGRRGPAEGALRLATRADLWARPECERSPVLEFLKAEQTLLINPDDAAPLGIIDEDVVNVSSDGRSIEATVQMTVRAGRGVVHLTEGTAENNANILNGNGPVAVQVKKAEGIATISLGGNRGNSEGAT